MYALVDAQINRVNIDDAKGGILAVEHVLSLGRRRTVFVGFRQEDEGLMACRARAFCNRMTEAGCEPPIMRFIDSASALEPFAELAVREKISAVFAGADRLALGLIRIFGGRGIAVPSDMSVIGFDGMGEVGPLRLTTIRQDIGLKARAALSLLISRIENPLSFKSLMSHS